MPEFHHPYNFIPATGKVNGSNTATTNYEDIRGGTPRAMTARHDLWPPDTWSGRIVYRLHLETPTVVGAKQRDQGSNLPKIVEPYRRNNKAAIPGNSLRGMIGSIAEALSQSTLRVLEDKPLAVSAYNRASRTTNKLQKGFVHEYFKDICVDLVPWNLDREKLTVAECLFGVVEEGKDKYDKTARLLASRVRFFDALPLPDVTPSFLHQVTLKILSSPKPPCPSMYFHPKNGRQGQFIAKADLNVKEHHPNGRKFYLHHRESEVNAVPPPWKTADPNENPDQKLVCEPLETNQDFFSHMDFENLSNAELTLLLTSLRPSESFRHKLGLGKPLGPGSVRVDIEGVFFVDRLKRYGNNALDEPRYHKCWRPKAVRDVVDWKDLYSREAEVVSSANVSVIESADFYKASLKAPLIDEETLNILRILGDRDRVVEKVQPPLRDFQLNNPERETFRWFVENERGNRQALKAVQADQNLPTLQTIP